jgi:glycosyl transferase family 25
MKTLNDYFDRIYCINLDRRVDRWNLVKEEFNKHSIMVNRYSAIDGNDLNLEVFSNPSVFETVGQLGCLISHYNVIKSAKHHNLSSVLIMEDDIRFCDDFNLHLEQKMQDVPDNWDMLFFGANHITRPIRVTDNIYKMTRAYSAHCYAIKNTMFDSLLVNLCEFKEPLDVTYANLQSNINSYVVNPHLVWQNPGYSDICEQSVDYTHVHKISF